MDSLCKLCGEKLTEWDQDDMCPICWLGSIYSKHMSRTKAGKLHLISILEANGVKFTRNKKEKGEAK